MTMSTEDRENLHAYLDEQLPVHEQTAFAKRLATEPMLAAAVTAEERFRTELRTRVLRTQAPATLHRKVRLLLQPTPLLPWWQRWWAWLATPQPIRPLAALALVLLLAVVGGVVWWAGQPTVEANRALATLFQRHEIYFENQPALDVTGNAAQIGAWFTARFPYPVQAPTLSNGWRLLGARLDEFQQQRTAHILYMRGNGQRTSLSIFPRQALLLPLGKKVRFAEQEFWVRDNGVHLAIVWESDQVGYALIGDIEIPSADLLQLAVEARTQLP